MSDSDASEDLDLGELILPPALPPGSAPAKPVPLQPWFLSKGTKRLVTGAPKCTQKHSNVPGKQSAAALVAKPVPQKKPLTPERAEQLRIDQEHVAVVLQELRNIRGYVMQREEENNAAFAKGEYPKWRLLPKPRKPVAAAGGSARGAQTPPAQSTKTELATGKKLALHRLLSCDDDEVLEEKGAVLVTYAEFTRASNEKVDVALLGHGAGGESDSRHMISRSNRESVTFDYALEHAKELVTSVPAFNGDHRLTGLQRLSTALMTQGCDKSVHLTVRPHGCDSSYEWSLRLPAHRLPAVILNNLTVAAGKTRATIFSTMRHIATAEAFAKTQAEYTESRLEGFMHEGSGLCKVAYVDPALTKLARVVIALVPAPVMQQWFDASMSLASTFKENAWITWTGIAPTRTSGARCVGGKKKGATSTPKTLPEAIKLTEERKCALFWVMEANTKSSWAALFTQPEYALPYRIIDEGTGAHLTEPRTKKPQSHCRYTIICNATLEQLKDHTAQQPKHPLRRAMNGLNMSLKYPRHCAVATLSSVPSWLRLLTGLSMAPLMPQGILKICMRVKVKSLAASLKRGSDMVITSTEDLIQGLVLDSNSFMNAKEKEELTANCHAILDRADPDISIVDNLTKAIEQVEKDERALLPMPEPEQIGGPLSPEQQIVADGIRRYRRVYGTMKRLFSNLRSALCPDPPPECPVTLDAIEPENVCILSCCTTLIDKQCVGRLSRCPMCRAQIKNVASAAQAADALQAASQTKQVEPDEKLFPAVVVRPGDTNSLVEAFRQAALPKCNSSLEGVVRSLELALQYKPTGLRALLCCNVWGSSQSYNSALDEEKNTRKTCAFLLKAVPQLDSVCTIGKGPKSKLPQYKAFDDTNRVLIIDTSARSTTMAGVDLPETDMVVFDRVSEGGSINTAKIVQSIGRAIRAQKQSVAAGVADHEYYRKHGHSRHAPKIVVFVDKAKTLPRKSSPAAPSPAAPSPAAPSSEESSPVESSSAESSSVDSSSGSVP
ncbi:MAG: hypothetical protein CMI29_08305 [Opitutae bacterium]|nr:hypothetical protein [Opitutae bacterium]|tara:strand:+ start:7742 stop:10765 length:3024 start_codon:yes stop_codon:yes gene_type:complete